MNNITDFIDKLSEVMSQSSDENKVSFKVGIIHNTQTNTHTHTHTHTNTDKAAVIRRKYNSPDYVDPY